jgi:hypothetical protein
MRPAFILLSVCVCVLLHALASPPHQTVFDCRMLIGGWHPDWGPRPGEPGCFVPREFLQ